MPQTQTQTSNEKPFTAQADETLTCRDCKTEFVFTIGEQEFFIKQGFTNRPGRCKECREAHKAKKNSTPRR